MMKDYYVCFPEEPMTDLDKGLRKSLSAFSDNEFRFNQYIIHTHPILQHALNEEYSLTLVKYSVNNLGELFDIVKEEHGCTITEDSEIMSITSENNPGFAIYMTNETYCDGSGIFNDPNSLLDTFLQSLWISVKMYDLYRSLMFIPTEVKNMMDLLSDKYLSISFALSYSDTGAWLNGELRTAVNKMLPDDLKDRLCIYDIVDDAMLWSIYNEWDTGCDDKEGDD